MKVRLRLVTRLLCLSLVIDLAGCASFSRDRHDATTPNIVLILADDQGWTGTSVRMSARYPDSRSDFYETPNLERFAAQGMRFSQAYAPAPNCSPTRAAIQTGRSPAALGMTDIIGVTKESPRYRQFYTGQKLIPPLPRDGLPHEEITIAERINAERPEYVTAHFGKWHLGSSGPQEHGYEVWRGPRSWEGQIINAENPKDIYGLTETAIGFLRDRAQKGEPFYLQVSHFAVHLPIRAHVETIGKYRESPKGDRHDHPGHAAMTDNLDEGVGMLLDAIADLGLAENTYVIYFSDNGAYTHGEFTNNLPLNHGKASVWEGGMRVPLIIRGPGIEPGSQCDVAVNGYDLYPTISDLLGLSAPLPDGVEGGSWAGLLANGGAGKVERPRDFMVWHFPHYQLGKGTTPQSAILDSEGWKLIEFYETGETKLFHLPTDLGERRDLGQQAPRRARNLKQQLHDYLAEIGAGMPVSSPDYAARAKPGPDSD